MSTTRFRRPPKPPRPELLRRPTGSFGWLEDHLLREGWLSRLGADGAAVLVLLALAADRHGASFYGRERMATALSMDRRAIDRALARLVELNLVAHRPWREGHPDGVWQLLPTPRSQPRRQPLVPVSIRAVLASLGFASGGDPGGKPPGTR